MTEPLDTPRGVRFAWIEGRGKDLAWYVASPLAGRLYVPVILLAPAWLERGAGQARFALNVAGDIVPVTVALVVVGSWSLLIDGPHFWPTLARTVLDREEWKTRGSVLGRSFLFFLLGPTLVAGPWIAARIVTDPAETRIPPWAMLGPPLALVVFLAWAYFHVVRQHWGFVRLYARRSGESDPDGARADARFFYTTMFLPPIFFLTHPAYPSFSELYPDFGLHRGGVAGVSVADVVYPLAWATYGIAIALYGVHVARRIRRGSVVSGSKLALLACVLPVHLVAFAHPALAVFSQALIGVGHALQYQRIVWRYGRRRYGTERRGGALARRVFGNGAVYAAFGLLFTFALLRGPWIEGLSAHAGRTLDRALALPLPGSGASLGVALVGSVFLGWLFQHYYLDAKIWRVGRDADVRRNLLTAAPRP